MTDSTEVKYERKDGNKFVIEIIKEEPINKVKIFIEGDRLLKTDLVASDNVKALTDEAKIWIDGYNIK